MKQYLLLDESGVCWRNLMAGEDTEDGREVIHPVTGKTLKVNSAAYGLDNVITNLLNHLDKVDGKPYQIILCADSGESKSLRRGIYPDYKNKPDMSRTEDHYKEFGKLREMVRELVLGLGGMRVEQPGFEADDIIAYLARTLKTPCVVVSNDGDMLPLVDGKRVRILDPMKDEIIDSDDLTQNKYGPFEFKYVRLWKALVGDSSDNLKGAKGFGPKAFLQMLVEYGEEGMDDLIKLLDGRNLDLLKEDAAEFKPFAKVVEFKADVYASWDCAKLYPERINTPKNPLTILPGMLVEYDRTKHDERLEKWYGKSRLVHAGNFKAFIEAVKPYVAQSPFVPLDIETSTPPESDDWLREVAKSKDKDEDGDLGVDVMGSRLTGMGLAFGDNLQYRLYLTHDHKETEKVKNLDLSHVAQFIELIPYDIEITCHNAGGFELPVMYNHLKERWAENGWGGFLPNVVDTQLMASYVNENESKGLKALSRRILGYEQTSYQEVTQGRKMNELTAAETIAYGLDDIITTAALRNYFQFVMELEGSLKPFYEVEPLAAYMGAKGYADGVDISLQTMFALEKEDNVAYERAWGKLRDYLINKGWEGSRYVPFELTPASVKQAYELVTGEQLHTMVRTISKMAKLVELGVNGSPPAPLLARLILEAEKTQNTALVDAYVKPMFSGEPEINFGSPIQMQKLLYEVIGLPVRLRNKPTDAMRAEKIFEGGAKTNDLAIQYALLHDTDKGEEAMEVLKALQVIKVVTTRRNLYYKKYRVIKHWKTGKVHASLRQCATVTRRYSSSGPNLQQLPKNAKASGEPPKFRGVIVPHKRNAVIVSMDFNAQELRIIAERSQDPNMLACYVGANKKDLHSLTAVGIMQREKWPDWNGPQTYAAFQKAAKDALDPLHKVADKKRKLGKKVNFTTEYGAMAPKLAETLICDEDTAQLYIDAREDQFKVASEWKESVRHAAKRKGYVTTMLGVRRHLPALFAGDRWEKMKAERQAVNMEIQGSAAEMTKQALGRMWTAGLVYKYDCRFYHPIHDEVVFSVALDDLKPFLKEAHPLMVAQYANMQVPIVSSISFGPDFFRQFEIGELPTDEAIDKGLAELYKLKEAA